MKCSEPLQSKYMIPIHVFKPLSHVPTLIPQGWIGWGLEHKPLNGAISAAILTNCYKLTLLEWS